MIYVLHDVDYLNKSQTEKYIIAHKSITSNSIHDEPSKK